MRVCLMIEGQEGVTWEQWLALALAAEAAGLDGLFRSDHYRSIGRGDPAGSLDAWATLAALAARTERIRLGSMVSPVTFRPASVLAKNVVTVDHVSHGRAELQYDPAEEARRDPRGNTTIAVVATNARLTKAAAKRFAIMAQDGFARAIRPSHTPTDGDTVFALATGKHDLGDDPYAFSALGTLAADCLARAVARGVYNAETLGSARSWKDVFGS